MKVLLVHNYYGFTGGEDIYFDNLVKVLEANGIKVILYSKDFKKLKNRFQKFKVFLNFFYSIQTVKEINSILKNEKPDVAHINNIYPIISPSIYSILIKNNIPIIQTAHNYRLFCSNGICLKNGKTCISCLKNSFRNIFNICRKDKKLYDFLLGINIFIVRILFLKYFKKIITLSNFQSQILIKSGIDKKRIALIRNLDLNNYLKFDDSLKNNNKLKYFNNDTNNNINNNIHSNIINKEYFLYIGRLSEEKGIKKLVDFFISEPEKKLAICGIGPLLNEIKLNIEKHKASNVALLGYKNKKDLIEIMKKAYAVIIPSICFEVLPLTIFESLKLGIPVIVNDIGSLTELVNDGDNGFKYKDFTTLKQILDNFLVMPYYELKKISENCKNYYYKFLNPQNSLTNLLNLYNEFL